MCRLNDGGIGYAVSPAGNHQTIPHVCMTTKIVVVATAVFFLFTTYKQRHTWKNQEGKIKTRQKMIRIQSVCTETSKIVQMNNVCVCVGFRVLGTTNGTTDEQNDESNDTLVRERIQTHMCWFKNEIPFFFHVHIWLRRNENFRIDTQPKPPEQTKWGSRVKAIQSNWLHFFFWEQERARFFFFLALKHCRAERSWIKAHSLCIWQFRSANPCT